MNSAKFLAHLSTWLQGEQIQLNNALLADYDFCQYHLDGEHPQFWRRSLVRTVVAYAEGTASLMRHCARMSLPPEEIDKRQALAGETVRIAKHGTIEKHPLRTAALDNICLAFRAYADLFRCGYPLNPDSEGWAALKSTIATRHRVTHPQKASDLEISAAEVLIAQTAFCYFVNSLSLLMVNGAVTLSAGRAKSVAP